MSYYDLAYILGHVWGYPSVTFGMLMISNVILMFLKVEHDFTWLNFIAGALFALSTKNRKYSLNRKILITLASLLTISVAIWNPTQLLVSGSINFVLCWSLIAIYINISPSIEAIAVSISLFVIRWSLYFTQLEIIAMTTTIAIVITYIKEKKQD